MGKNSKIAWTDHTFNPWWGCTKTSEGCQNCYAERQARRFHDVWGADKPRRFFDAKHWMEPTKWNRDAAKSSTRAKVFCGSMCDIFEARNDLIMKRYSLWGLIRSTQSLDWLLLTKRPENVMAMLPKEWQMGLPHNVWMGITAENQEAADERIPLLLQIPAAVRFVSAEPLLSAIDLSPWLDQRLVTTSASPPWVRGIVWTIVAAESGPGARPMDEDWVRDLRDQCVAAGIPYFYKQRLENGKKVSMPELDGQVWDQFPEGVR